MLEDHEELLLSERQGEVGTLILNRPRKRNALTPALLVEIHRQLARFAEQAVRVVVIRGAGEEAFSAGYDIGSIPPRERPELQDELERQDPLQLSLDAIVHYPFPVIAMLNGCAYGGGLELAICCDLRVGSAEVKLGMPAGRLGVVYPIHGLERVVALVGLAATKRLFFTARPLDGEQAHELGLIDYLVPAVELEHFVYQLAEEIAENAPLSLQGTKRILNLLGEGHRLSGEAAVEAQTLVDQAFASDDLKEGQRAFMEKRRPVFKGC